MGKKLAIKGHVSRGKEVIELFKMMGGCECGYCGGGTGFYYYISQFGNIEASCKPTEFDTYIVYTLEEFLEKFPYKVGDKVYIYIQNDDIDGRYDIEVAEITSMRWNPARCKIAYKMKDINREFYKEEIKCKVDDELVYCERFKNLMDNSGKLSVKNHKMGPKSKLPLKYYEDKLEEIQSKRECDELRMPLNDNENNFPLFEPMFKVNDELEYKIPDGYEITEVSKDTVFIKPIKSKYPTTYAECCDVLNIPNDERYIDIDVPLDYNKLVSTFTELLICRKAYWKIAGEEMGLDKPWEPDLENEELYCIQNYNKQITISRTNTAFNKILIFPTGEMRDAFYENFKELIEQCKELL